VSEGVNHALFRKIWGLTQQFSEKRISHGPQPHCRKPGQERDVRLIGCSFPIINKRELARRPDL
jgi:hypothetical protein